MSVGHSGVSDTQLVISRAGNVGIRTITPTTTLHINGSLLAAGASSISSQSTHIQWNKSNGDGETWILNQKGGGTSNDGIRFGSSTTAGSTTEWMLINDSGNVGIGISPTYKLDVSGICRLTSSQTGFSQGGLSIVNNAPNTPNLFSAFAPSISSGQSAQFYIGQSANTLNCGHLNFSYNGSGNTTNNLLIALYIGANYLCCSNNGIGVDTTNPLFPFDVNGKSRFSNCASFNYTSSTIGSTGSQTWTVSNVESRLIVRSGLTGTTSDTMPSRTDFVNAGYITGDTIEFVVHNLSTQTYSLTSSGNQYNSMAVLTNVPKKFLLRITASAIDIYAI